MEGEEFLIITPFRVAQTFIGTKELSTPGQDNHLIQAMIESCDHSGTITDEIPWCSAFVNFVCKTLGLPRSKSLAAKSWLSVGSAIHQQDCLADSDIVILNRGSNPAQGHVGFFAGRDTNYGLQAQNPNKFPVMRFFLLGGNQSNQVCIEEFDLKDVAGFRRLVI